MDQLLTPYPKTDLRKEMLAAGLVANEEYHGLGRAPQAPE